MDSILVVIFLGIEVPLSSLSMAKPSPISRPVPTTALAA